MVKRVLVSLRHLLPDFAETVSNPNPESLHSMQTPRRLGEPWLSPGRLFLSPDSAYSLFPPASPHPPTRPLSGPHYPPGLPHPLGQAHSSNAAAELLLEPIVPEIRNERHGNGVPLHNATVSPNDNTRIGEYRDKMIVDLTFLATWVVYLMGIVQYVIKTADRVMKVKAFATGFWEVHERKEYCLGPVPNPLPNRFSGDKIHVVVTEDCTTFKHSFWPTLAINAPGDTANDSNSDGNSDEWAISELDIPAEPEPPEFSGQLKGSEVCGIHRAMYTLLFISRALCFAIVHCAIHALPHPLPMGRIIKSDFEVFHVPPVETVMQAQSANLYAPEIYKPLRLDLIRGPEAVKAARRAGFKFRI